MIWSKYHAKKTLVDGRLFDSKKEAQVYCDLKLQKAAGQIVDFQCQVSFPIIVNDKKVCVYRADFVTYTSDGARHVIDVKGYRTAIYRLKKKLMEAANNIIIEER